MKSLGLLALVPDALLLSTGRLFPQTRISRPPPGPGQVPVR
jgi:hypothetical protein